MRPPSFGVSKSLLLLDFARGRIELGLFVCGLLTLLSPRSVLFRIESLLRMASTTSALVAKRAVGKLYPQQTAMLLVDIQERFRPLIFRSETIIRTAQYMTSVAKALDIPIVATQQYTKVFGPTVPECFATAEDLNETPIFEKKLFSMCTDEVSEHLAKLNRSSYIIFGIEAHVCVQQTALDLLEVRKCIAA